MRIVFLILILVTMSFAETWNDEWPIYVYGDASYYKLIFDGIAMIVQDDSFMKSVFKMLFGVSALFAAKSMVKYDLGGVMWNVAAGLGMTSMLLYPSSTVHILDVRTLHGYIHPDISGETAGDYSGYQKADNIPLYLAVSASLASSLKYYIIDIATDALTPIDGGSLRDSGFATPMTLAEDMISTASFKYSVDDTYKAPIFGQALSHYTEKCIIENVLYIDQTEVHRIMDPKSDSLAALNPANYDSAPHFLRSVVIESLQGGASTTCGAFWDTFIASNIVGVKTAMIENLQAKHKDKNINGLASSMTYVAGLESDAAIAMATMQNAMLNIATSSVVMRAFEKAGAGLSGIELSNEMMAQQSLTTNMVDSTGQFKWMIRVVPVLEFLIFGILIFLGVPMALVAGLSGVERGGKMLINYSFGLIAFSFIDVALAIVQAISLYYYKNKMADTVLALGGNPFTANSITPYMQEMAYMSGMMGLAAVIVVPIVVSVVFKGETMAAMGAYSSVMGKYKGDAGGQNAKESLSNAASVHTAEAAAYEEYAAAREEYARRNLSDYGIPVPQGALASQMWDKISAEAASYGASMGTQKVGASTNDGSLVEFSKDRALAGMGTGMQKVTAEIASGTGILNQINTNPSALSDFGHQTRTDAEAGFASQAAKGKFSKDNEDYSREKQIDAAKVMANDGLLKSVEMAKGLSNAGVFNSDGSIGKDAEFAKYAKGTEVQARTQANKTMGTGLWAEGKSEQDMIDAMSDIQRVGAMGMASEVAKGRGFKDGKYKGDLSKFESDSTDIEKSKSDSMFGQAEGVRKNYAKNKDIYSQNAEYGEESKQQATDAKIKAAGNVAKAVAVDVADASLKATQQIEGLKGSSSEYLQSKEGGSHSKEAADKMAQAILSGGSGAAEALKSALSGAGALAFAQSAAKTGSEITTLEAYENADSFVSGQKRDALSKVASSVVMENLANNDEAKAKITNEEKKQIFNAKGQAGLDAYIKEGQAMGFLNKNGDANEDADSWVKGRATFSASGMNKNEQGVIAGTRLSTAFNALSGEAISNVDGTRVLSDGTKTTANIGDSGNMEAQRTREGVEHVLSPISKGLPALIGKTHNDAKKWFEEKGLSEDSASSMATIATAGGASVVATGLVEAGTRIKNSIMGNRLATESFSYDTGNVNRDGEAIMKTVEKGEHFSTNKNAALADYVKNNKVSVPERGIPGKFMSKLFDSTKLPSSENSMPNDSSNPSTSTQNQSTDSSHDGKSNNKVHNDSLNSDTDSVSKNTEKSKKGYDGFFSDRFNAASDAFDGSGSWKKRTALAASAIILGSASETFANTIEALDPSSFFTGTAAGSGSHGGDELKQMMAANHSAAPQHQGFMSQPSGHNTHQALLQDQTAQAQLNTSGNIATLTSISQSRSGGFALQDGNGMPVSFTTDKGSGHNLMMNGQDTGVGYNQFSSMMQNGEMAAQFGTALASSDISNKDAYGTINNILQDMNYQSAQANMRQRVHNNASETNASMRHKEATQALSEDDGRYNV